MKKRMIIFVALYLAVFAILANGQERRLEKKDLPTAVQASIDRESAGATVRGFSTERENGIRTYEAEMMVNGRSKDISLDAKGNVLEIEEEVTMDSLPEAVRTSLTAKAGRGKIGKIESLTKKGRLVAYEAIVTNGTKRREVQVGPNGEKLVRPE